MKPIAAMSTVELTVLIPSLRNDISRAQAAENLVLLLDLRKALSLVSNELKARRASRVMPALRA